MIFSEVRIDEIASMKYGKMPKKELIVEKGYPVYSGYRVTGYAKEFLYAEPQLVVVARGVGGTGDVKISPPNSWITNLSIVLDLIPEQIDKTYLYYKLSREPLKEKLNTGAAQAQITIGNLSSFKIKIPSLETQRNVVNIISKYDTLIENNKRRIALLEESARQLYKEWFVRFRFPGHEHVKIVDGVPEGWEYKEISELSSYLSRGMTPKYDEEGEYIVINQKCIRNRLLSTDLARRQSKEVKEEKLLRVGDVLINSTGVGTLGRVAQCWLDIGKCTADTHVTIVRPKVDVSAMWFGYCLMELESIFEGMGQGATNQKELRRDLVASMRVLVPSVGLQSTFEEYAYKCSKQIVLLGEENARLSKARDILLPKLMSGELAV